MASLNKVTLIGHLGADPDVKNTKDGRQIVNLRLATSESWKDKSTGERKEKSEWHSIVIFSEGLAKVASQYLKKGSKVYVEGQLQTEKYTDKDGIDRYTTKIVLQGFNASLILLDGKSDNSNFSSQQYANAKGGASSYKPKMQESHNFANDQESHNFANDLDDDIPF